MCLASHLLPLVVVLLDHLGQPLLQALLGGLEALDGAGVADPHGRSMLPQTRGLIHPPPHRQARVSESERQLPNEDDEEDLPPALGSV